MPTIIGDELGGSAYRPPAPARASMASLFGTAARGGREGREAPTGTAGVERGRGYWTFQRKEPPPPIPTETVQGDPFGGSVVAPPKPKRSLASIFGPGRAGGSQAYADPRHQQAERDFRDWAGL